MNYDWFPPDEESIHPLSIEAIVLACYPLCSTKVSTVSILYQSRLSFWLFIASSAGGNSASIHPLSIEAIVLATSVRSRCVMWYVYPSSINRGYRSGPHFLDRRSSHVTVSILYQSRLSFWLPTIVAIAGHSPCIHPLSIEAIVLALNAALLGNL